MHYFKQVMFEIAMENCQKLLQTPQLFSKKKSKVFSVSSDGWSSSSLSIEVTLCASVINGVMTMLTPFVAF